MRPEPRAGEPWPEEFVAPAVARRTAPLSERFPALYPVAVLAHRTRRRVQWLRSDTDWATTRSGADLPALVKRHESPLLRQLGDSQMWLQHNKVTNLRLVAERLDGLLIRPGETLSFNRAVGKLTRRKGYLEGMQLSAGHVSAEVGGGVCQVSNLLVWLALHSPLTIAEQSTHSFDPFPDNERVVPWGVGATIVYNYVDLQLRNDTDTTFQWRISVGAQDLGGELRAGRQLPVSYEVESREEQFLRMGEQCFRRNQIWRTVRDRRTGAVAGEELVRKNCAVVRYVPTGVHVIDAS